MTATATADFVGVDPGSSGAACLLTVRDALEGDAHGRVLCCRVSDLPTVGRDRGGHDLDVESFVLVFAWWRSTGPIVRAVVERPAIGGRGFGASSAVTQGWNAGAAWAALHDPRLAVRQIDQADPTAGRWYAEGGWGVERGGDRAATSIRHAESLFKTWERDGAEVFLAGTTLTKDRADAVLLAYLGVLRWLGRAVQPADPGGAKRRRAAQRRAGRTEKREWKETEPCSTT